MRESLASPDISETVHAYMDQLQALLPEDAHNDPAFAPLRDQVINHLKHVSYSFRIAADSDDYPYELRQTAAFPPEPTARALAKADQFFAILADPVADTSILTLPESFGEQAKLEQDEFVAGLLDDPLGVYDDFSERRNSYGDEASFPELGGTVRGLLYDMVAKSEIDMVCERSPLLQSLRGALVSELVATLDEGKFGYKSTVLLIEDAVAFFDCAVRVTVPDSPAPYHSARFEYNWHAALADSDLTLIPTMGSVTSADLLKIRGVPVALLGVSTETITVDGFPQTPYEFFMHDVDHTRRMHEETRAAIEREGVTPRSYAADATDLLHNVLLPEIDVAGVTDQEEQDHRIAMRMILFEILHEDANDPVRDTIAEAILRAPMERTPFEREVDGEIIEYFVSPRASMLAHVFRKLAHTFYDFPEKRSSNLGTDFVRTRSAIASGAAHLYRLVSDDPIEDEDLLAACKDLVSTDEGFTDAFIGNIAHDIRRRAAGRSTLQLMIAKPKGVQGAVREARARAEGRQIHSLFGYAALEYQEPEHLEQTVIDDLGSFNPEETAIAIGATPYGIGRLYPAVKELGFLTLGIVASTALGQDEECAEGVDEIVVVRDTGWGGYRYNQGTNGLLSPTTRVFVGASDSIAAYGGGGITAATLPAALRRGKTVSFKPFDMNHRIARMLHEQKGDNGPIDFRGPAHEMWKNLQRED